MRIGAMLLLLATSAAKGVWAAGPAVDPAGAYGRLPLVFEKNVGQTDAAVTFLSRGKGYDVFLTPTEAVLKLAASSMETPAVLRMTLVGASRHPRISGFDEMQGRMNYFVGRDASRWRTNIATYAKVKYAGVYPGVDLVYYGNQRELEYDLVVAPHTNPNVIVLAFGGADHLEIDRDGALLISIGGRVMRQHRPFVYQEIDGVRREVRGDYVLKGKMRVGVRLGAYDRRKPLVIDPVLAYSTFLGGSGGDFGSGIAVDAAGNVYVAGGTSSIDFPTTGSIPAPGSGSQGIFIAKLNPSGSALLYSTYIGGASFQMFSYSNLFFYPGFVGAAIGLGRDTVPLALAADGSIYVTGPTASEDFPTTPGAFQTVLSGPGQQDAFVLKLNAAGNGLVYSTYLGGNHSTEWAAGIAVDGAGNAYITGSTDNGLPTTPGALQTVAVGQSAFVTKLNPTGTALVYSTFLGGTGIYTNTKGQGIAVDSRGSAYVTGVVYLYDEYGPFPTTSGAFYAGHGAQGLLPFVSKLNPAGTALEYSTLLGPAASCGQGCYGVAIAVDAAGNAYVASQVWTAQFPTTPNTLQPSMTDFTFTSAYDAGTVTVTKLNSTGSALVYSTYLSHRYGGWPSGIAVDGLGSAYITGVLFSFDADPPDGTPLGPVPCHGEYPFVAKLNPAGSALVYLSYHCSPTTWGAVGTAVAVDGAGTAYVTGYTNATWLPFPTTAGVFQTQQAGDSDAFIWKVTNASAETAIGTNVSVYPGPAGLTFSNVASAGSATVVTLDPAAAANFLLSDNLAAYDVSTTATYFGPITLCFPVTGISDELVFNNVTIMHVESGVPVDRTSSRDFVNRTVCATVTTLSPFVIVKGAIDQLNALVALVRSFNLQRGIENSLDAKLQNAQNAVTAVKAHDKATACNAMSAFVSEVQAQAGKSLTQTQVGILVGRAGEIRTVLGCR